ncbi:hypothetical protein DFJ73DRAFT_446372 [Zopfochytrium polystomum]|nr:hypothetical protein DFJ73DRAFT_446372 [Zopfochytrium polystomum]
MILPNRAELLAAIEEELASALEKLEVDFAEHDELLAAQGDALTNAYPRAVREISTEDFCLKHEGSIAKFKESQAARSKARQLNIISTTVLAKNAAPPPPAQKTVIPPFTPSTRINTTFFESPAIGMGTVVGRRAKLNETLMSVNGSPVANPWLDESFAISTVRQVRTAAVNPDSSLLLTVGEGDDAVAVDPDMSPSQLDRLGVDKEKVKTALKKWIAKF